MGFYLVKIIYNVPLNYSFQAAQIDPAHKLPVTLPMAITPAGPAAIETNVPTSAKPQTAPAP